MLPADQGPLPTLLMFALAEKSEMPCGSGPPGVGGGGGVPQAKGVPPPPHVAGEAQLPQLSSALQPSEGVPQVALNAAQVVGMQTTVEPHTFARPPPPQVCPAMVQPPQSRVPPQPSGTVPQLTAWSAHDFGAHVAPLPQTLAIPPPPQLAGAVQVPQSIFPPQPSEIVPQFFP